MTPPVSDTDGPNSLTADKQHEIMSSRYRRYTLYSLRVFTTPVTLARVADYVTEWDFGVAAGELPNERLEIYMTLYHDYLPCLIEDGVVVYNQEDDTLEPGPNMAQLQPALEKVMAKELTEQHERLVRGG
ncbi:hypothetical protein [Haloarcula sp. JP-L23]|uniref:DUF7344 domain-containing protein n=1 Tax=Haloarcula sp. JP-L23 TaxID=2716717 RepID=UPI00140EC643|nr:hypothetical protein G9465_19350 [Haloarcula sp. JP-L23]